MKLQKLFLQDPEEFRRIVLTDLQVRIVRFTQERREVDVNDVAAEFKYTIQNASHVLAKIASRGYLKREQIARSNGGYKFVYYPVVKL